MQVACGKEHAAAVTEDGELYTWGKGEYMQLGHGDAKDVATPRKVDGLVGMKVVQVACGDFHTAAVGNEGQLWTWGWGGSMFSGAGPVTVLCAMPPPSLPMDAGAAPRRRGRLGPWQEAARAAANACGGFGQQRAPHVAAGQPRSAVLSLTSRLPHRTRL